MLHVFGLPRDLLPSCSLEFLLGSSAIVSESATKLPFLVRAVGLKDFAHSTQK